MYDDRARPDRVPAIDLSDSAVIVAVKDQVSCDLGEETVILAITPGVYYGLNPVGARIWSLIQTPRTIAELRARLLEEYQVDPDRCNREVSALLEDLGHEGLIEVSRGSAAG